jgi:hypothetical protein
MVFFDENTSCKNCGNGGGTDTNTDQNIIDKNIITDKDSKDKDKNIDENSKTEMVFGSFILLYKTKLGLGEEQEITIYDSNRVPQTDKNIVIKYNDSNWTYTSDVSGKIVFVPIYEGKYSLAMKYDGQEISGEFEVISGYISSSNDFVELVSKTRTFGMNAKARTTIVIASLIIAIIALGIILYFIFIKQKPDSPYEFKPLN